MKTTVKQLVAGIFIALLLLVVNVKAEETEIKDSNHESIEATLQLENWMSDETILSNNSFNNAEFVQETETSMELESWMTSEETWNIKDIDSESELTIEKWMIDCDFWK